MMAVQMSTVGGENYLDTNMTDFVVLLQFSDSDFSAVNCTFPSTFTVYFWSPWLFSSLDAESPSPLN